MTLEYQVINFSELSDDAVIIIEKVGISSELMEEKIHKILPYCSRTFHEGLVSSKILGSNENWDIWFNEGFPSRMLQPGEQWKDGKTRLRIVAEFIPDEPEIIPTDRPIEPSLDTFRDRP